MPLRNNNNKSWSKAAWQRQEHFCVDFSPCKMRHESGKQNRAMLGWEKGTWKSANIYSLINIIKKERKDVGGGAQPWALP